MIGFVELSLTLAFVTARRSMVRLNASARSADSMPTAASTYPVLGLLETSSCGAMRAMRAWARGWSGERAWRRLSVCWLVGAVQSHSADRYRPTHLILCRCFVKTRLLVVGRAVRLPVVGLSVGVTDGAGMACPKANRACADRACAARTSIKLLQYY